MSVDREAPGKVIDTFWMPSARPVEQAELSPVGPPRLTPEEQAVLRRLRRGEKRLWGRVTPKARKRTLLRRRRQALDRLTVRDLRSLAQIVLQLGL